MNHAYCPMDGAAESGFSVVAVENGTDTGPSFYAAVYLAENPVWEHTADPADYPAGIQDFANHTMVLFSRRLSAVLAEPGRVRSDRGVDELAAVIRKVDGSNSLGAGALAEAIVDEQPAGWEPCPHCAASVGAER